MSSLPPSLLAPDALPSLWKGGEIAVKDVLEYFGGGRVVKVKRNGYEEPLAVPRVAEPPIVGEAIRTGVREGILWLTSGPASILGEDIPEGLLTPDAHLQGPPAPVPATAILPDNLDCWTEGSTTALAVSVALSKKSGKNLPWDVVRRGIVAAIQARLVELSVDSGPWPCDYLGARSVRIRLPKEAPPSPPPPPAPGVLVAEATLRANEIQDLAEQIPELVKSSVGLDLVFRLKIELSGKSPPSKEIIQRLTRLLKEANDALELR